MLREPSTADVNLAQSVVYAARPFTAAQLEAQIVARYEPHPREAPPADQPNWPALDDLSKRFQLLADAYRTAADVVRQTYGDLAGIPDAPYAPLRRDDPPPEELARHLQKLHEARQAAETARVAKPKRKRRK